MRRFPFLLPSVLALLLSLAVAGAHADALEMALLSQYPAGSIKTVAQATTALEDVADTRRLVENDYAATRNACLQKFFMAACFDRAKEQRRIALAKIRKVEIEASAYLRKEKADERDRGVAERQSRATARREQPGLPFKGAARPEPMPDQPADKSADKP